LATSQKITQYLINTCRSFIYSTALPPAVIAGNIESLNLLKKEPWRRRELLKCADFFRTTLKARGFNVKGSSQIVPLILGDNFKAIACARRLQNKGYWVMPIRPPTVPENEARLRFSLTIYHNQPILQRLINELPKK
jgi:7-keto-8-aminopelargonate synthetase-like enzyme